MNTHIVILFLSGGRFRLVTNILKPFWYIRTAKFNKFELLSIHHQRLDGIRRKNNTLSHDLPSFSKFISRCVISSEINLANSNNFYNTTLIKICLLFTMEYQKIELSQDCLYSL